MRHSRRYDFQGHLRSGSRSGDDLGPHTGLFHWLQMRRKARRDSPALAVDATWRMRLNDQTASGVKCDIHSKFQGDLRISHFDVVFSALLVDPPLFAQMLLHCHSADPHQTWHTWRTAWNVHITNDLTSPHLISADLISSEFSCEASQFAVPATNQNPLWMANCLWSSYLLPLWQHERQHQFNV